MSKKKAGEALPARARGQPRRGQVAERVAGRGLPLGDFRLPGARRHPFRPAQMADEILEKVPFPGEELVATGDDAGGDPQLIGQSGDFGLGAQPAYDLVMPGRDQQLRGKPICPLFPRGPHSGDSLLNSLRL